MSTTKVSLTNKVLKNDNSFTNDKRGYSGQSFNTHSIRYRTKEIRKNKSL